jgi:hypothetical protein
MTEATSRRTGGICKNSPVRRLDGQGAPRDHRGPDCDRCRRAHCGGSQRHAAGPQPDALLVALCDWLCRTLPTDQLGQLEASALAELDDILPDDAEAPLNADEAALMELCTRARIELDRRRMTIAERVTQLGDQVIRALAGFDLDTGHPKRREVYRLIRDAFEAQHL